MIHGFSINAFFSEVFFFLSALLTNLGNDYPHFVFKIEPVTHTNSSTTLFSLCVFFAFWSVLIDDFNRSWQHFLETGKHLQSGTQLTFIQPIRSVKKNTELNFPHADGLISFYLQFAGAIYLQLLPEAEWLLFISYSVTGIICRNEKCRGNGNRCFLVCYSHDILFIWTTYWSV